jgi:hypothetical protein
MSNIKVRNKPANLNARPGGLKPEALPLPGFRGFFESSELSRPSVFGFRIFPPE